MAFKLEHTGLYVRDLEKSAEFYRKAFGLEVRRHKSGGDLDIYFMGNDESPAMVELISRAGHTGSYDLGDRSSHLAFRAEDIGEAMALHKSMNCIAYEMPEFGIYFVSDPDGYLSEVMPTRK